MSVYEEGVISMHPNLTPIVGKSAVRAIWESLLSTYSIDASAQVKEVEIAVEWACERSAYRMTFTPKEGGEAIRDEGKNTDIVRLQPDVS